MKEINDAKKIEGGRRAYDYKKMKDLMDQGLLPVKIASRLHTSSVQSIRHSMERIKNPHISRMNKYLLVELHFF